MTLGNQAGLRAFEYTWEELTSLPSRKSCDDDWRLDRSEYLESMLEGDDTARARQYSAVSQEARTFAFRVFVENVP